MIYYTTPRRLWRVSDSLNVWARFKDIWKAKIPWSIEGEKKVDKNNLLSKLAGKNKIDHTIPTTSISHLNHHPYMLQGFSLFQNHLNLAQSEILLVVPHMKWHVCFKYLKYCCWNMSILYAKFDGFSIAAIIL